MGVEGKEEMKRRLLMTAEKRRRICECLFRRKRPTLGIECQALKSFTASLPDFMILLCVVKIAPFRQHSAKGHRDLDRAFRERREGDEAKRNGEMREASTLDGRSSHCTTQLIYYAQKCFLSLSLLPSRCINLSNQKASNGIVLS